jgi:hypothetical protein
VGNPVSDDELNRLLKNPLYYYRHLSEPPIIPDNPEREARWHQQQFERRCKNAGEYRDVLAQHERRWLEEDYRNYKEQIDTSGSWRVEWGKARVIASGLLHLLKAANDQRILVNDRKKARMVDKKDAAERPWELTFDSIQLTAHMDGYLSVAVPVLDENLLTLASIPQRVAAMVHEPFSVVISLSALLETTRLMKPREAVELSYHWLTFALHVIQSGDAQRTRLWTWEHEKPDEYPKQWPPLVAGLRMMN